MKVKLLAIVVLALVLCAAVPMAATAAKPTAPPEARPFTGTVYLFDANSLPPYPTPQLVGHVVIHDGHTYIYTVNHLDPSQRYFVGCGKITSNTRSLVAFTAATSDADGHITLRSTMSDESYNSMLLFMLSYGFTPMVWIKDN